MMGYLGRLLFRIFLIPWLRLRYRVRRIGALKVPSYGCLLVAANRVTAQDPLIHYLTSPRRLRFLVSEKLNRNPGLGWFLRLFQCIPFDQNDPSSAVQGAVEALNKGSAICVFPEKEPTRNGVTGPLSGICQTMASEADCPVVPCYADGLWQSPFSWNPRYRHSRMPRLLCPIQLAYGDPIESDDATTARIFEGMLAASIDAFAARRCFEHTLEVAVIDALKRGRTRNFTFEYANEPRRWSRAEFLGLAMAIARRWINSPPDSRDRIGILLPPGPTPAVINLGLFLGGKTPVNLPFNLRADEVEKLALKMESLGIRTVITSKAFMPHLIDFWRGEEGRFIDITAELSGAGALILSQERFFSRFEPAWLTKWRLEFRQRDKNREALGMIGDATQAAVFLTSEQLYRNAIQIGAADFIREGDTILSEAPMNSIVGQMMNLWVPLLHSGRAICRSYSKRDDIRLLRALAEGQNGSILVGDLNFFQDAEREQFNIPRLRCGIIFDETADQERIAELEEDMHLPLVKGWHHSGRIVALSQPQTGSSDGPATTSAGCKSGAEGRILPGFGARVVNGEFFLRFDSIVVSRKSDQARSNQSQNDAPPEEKWIRVGPGPWIDDSGFLHLKPS